MSTARILIVDDDDDLRKTLEAHITDLGHQVLAVDSAESALNEFAEFDPEIVFSEVQRSGLNGFELLLFTGEGGGQGAIDATTAGATDYHLKPLDQEEIEGVIERCIKDRAVRKDAEPPAESIASAPGGLVGRHPSMVNVYKKIGAVASTRAAVLIQGETGTGKELIARTVHENSSEADQPFIAINCAAVPETLLESTLFGHIKGAFTGASSDRRGPFELAGRGTIFLDEIGDTPVSYTHLTLPTNRVAGGWRWSAGG